jgi:2-polyprenyl-6-methoxyphenol hydroxylase-like FAD-dependent oxidoreductase
VELDLKDIDTKYPKLAALVGGGSMFALGDNKALIAQRNSGHKVKVYANFRVPESQIQDTQVSFSEDPAILRAHLLDLFEGWDNDLASLIRLAEDNLIARSLYALPIGHSWTPRPGITMIGDAAHVMSPFSGEGANLAMLDGAELALAIASGRELDTAIAETEERMCHRAAVAAEESAGNLEAFIHPDAPGTALKRLKDVMVRHRGPNN